MSERNDTPPDSLVQQLRADAGAAAARVDDEFRSRLVRLAEKFLDPRARAGVDAEDVAQSVLKSFFHRQATEPVSIESREELWHLLAAVARRKCVKAARRELAQKRGGDRKFLPGASGAWDAPDQDAIPPEAVAVMSDLYQELLARLDEWHRPVCELRLDGFEVNEIAARLNVSSRTVERRLAQIRKRLAALDPEE
jgi:RNA polymerase sigma factor (sigma-70 family)